MISKLDWFLVSILDHFFITFGLPNGSQMAPKSAKNRHFGGRKSGFSWFVCRPCSRRAQNRLRSSKSEVSELKKWPLGLQKWPLGLQKWSPGLKKWPPNQEKLSSGIKKLSPNTKRPLWTLKTIHYFFCLPLASKKNTTHYDILVLRTSSPE